jgi:hypothetical protein
MTATRPLPRSLDPLPDESIIGFMLRLAHRLEITPTRLVKLTGLDNAGYANHERWTDTLISS